MKRSRDARRERTSAGPHIVFPELPRGEKFSAMNQRIALCALAVSACGLFEDPDDDPDKKATIAFSQSAFFGAAKSDSFISLAPADDGSVYVGGTSKELLDDFYSDFTVVKLSATGTVQWARAWGGAQHDEVRPHIDSEGEGSARHLAAAPGGGVFVAGLSNSVADFNAAVLLHYSSDGALSWARAWKPNWSNQANSEAKLMAVTATADTVYTVGTTGGEAAWLLQAFTLSGGAKWSVAIDPSAGLNDRPFSVVAGGTSLYAGGWVGTGNEGLIIKLNVAGALPTIDWAVRVKLPLGSTIPDLDVDGEGNLYAAADIHGVGTYHAVLKLSPAGSLLWAREYNRAVESQVDTTHVVRAYAGGVIVGGRVSYTQGSDVETDRVLGDSVFFIVNADGTLKSDAYYFTGNEAQAGGGTMDRVRGLLARDGKLIVAGNTWSETGQYTGTWRTPASRGITPSFTESTEILLQTFNVGTVEDLSAIAPLTEAEITGAASSDITQAIVSTPSASADGTAKSTQGFIFWFDGLL